MFLNDKIVAYLNQNKIAFSGPDFVVVFDDKGVESISTWNATKLGTQPTQDVLDAAGVAASNAKTQQTNKEQASKLLTATDWVEIPSVSNTANTPHLVNYNDFMAYRLALRAIAVNPSVTPATFPTIPTEQWA